MNDFMIDDVMEGIVLDALFWIGFRFSLSQALKVSLHKVVTYSGYVGV